MRRIALAVGIEHLAIADPEIELAILGCRARRRVRGRLLKATTRGPTPHHHHRTCQPKNHNRQPQSLSIHSGAFFLVGIRCHFTGRSA
jgi:hypothetical protein